MTANNSHQDWGEYPHLALRPNIHRILFVWSELFAKKKKRRASDSHMTSLPTTTIVCSVICPVLPLFSRQTTNTDPPALHTTNSHLWGYPSAAVHCYHRWLVRSYCLPSRPILWMNHCFAWAMDFCAPISLTWKWHSCVGCCYRCTLSLMWQLRRLLLTFLGWAGDRQEETIYFLFFFIIVMCFVWERYKQQF